MGKYILESKKKLFARPSGHQQFSRPQTNRRRRRPQLQQPLRLHRVVVRGNVGEDQGGPLDPAPGPRPREPGRPLQKR